MKVRVWNVTPDHLAPEFAQRLEAKIAVDPANTIPAQAAAEVCVEMRRAGRPLAACTLDMPAPEL